MELVRVTAEYKEGGYGYSDYRIVVLCGIDQEHQLAQGEWFGYVRNEKIFYPFVLRHGNEFSTVVMSLGPSRQTLVNAKSKSAHTSRFPIRPTTLKDSTLCTP